MSIFTHVTLGTNDISSAHMFYDIVLGTLGLKRLTVNVQFYYLA